MRALVVGAGLAGATAARRLAQAGYSVQLIDKGRGPGGRLSTRRAGEGGFDHGASALSAQHPDFIEWVALQEAEGRAARWLPRTKADPLGKTSEGWVGVPGMNALVAATLDGLAPQWSQTVAALRRRDGIWRAFDAEGQELGAAPMLVLAIPAPQALALLPPSEASADTEDVDGLSLLMDELAAFRYRPCWAAMLTVSALENDARFDFLCPADGVLAAAYGEAAKPGRPEAGHWVLHADEAWSETHLEDSAESVAQALGAAFCAASGVSAASVHSVIAHRWRYSRPIGGLAKTTIPAAGLFLAGDMVGDAMTSLSEARASAKDGLNAERAWLSGRAAAEACLAAGARLQPKS